MIASSFTIENAMIEPNNIISTIVGLSPSWIIIFVLPVMALCYRSLPKRPLVITSNSMI
jgi:hypothetical protein